MNSIDLGRAFKAPFDDPDWVKKTLMGFLWMLLGVTAPAVTGAMLDYIRGVSQGREELPEWDNFGDKWVRGFMVGVAGMIYFLPILVLGVVFAVPAILAAASGGEDAAGGLMAGGMCLFWLIAIVYGVAVSALFYAAFVNYAMKGTFGAMFEFSAILDKVRGGTGYWSAWMYALIVSFAAGTISSVLSATGVGAILYPAVAYLAYMMTGHIFGQWARTAFGGGAQFAPSPFSPPAAPAAPAPPAYAPPAPPAAPEAPAPPAYAPPAPPAAPAPPAPPAAPVAPPTPEAPPAPPAPPTPGEPA